MPVAVVDGFEVIEIDKCNRYRPLTVIRISHGLMQAGGKIGPVGQARQGIVKGNMLKLTLMFFG